MDIAVIANIEAIATTAGIADTGAMIDPMRIAAAPFIIGTTAIVVATLIMDIAAIMAEPQWRRESSEWR